MLTSGTEAIEKIIGVGLRELSGVLELGDVVLDVVVLLNSLNNVSLAFKLKELLGDHDVGVMDGHYIVAKISFRSVKVGWVTEGTLIVGNGPLRGRHNTEVAVSVGVDAADESVLGEVSFLDYS